MSPSQALAGLRIAPVPYLNARPLIWGIDSKLLVPDIPARLSDKLREGAIDIALLPVFDILRLGYGRIVDNVAIACEGQVFSVIVASKEPVKNAEEIFHDPASRSSSALLRVLIANDPSWRSRVVEAEPPEGRPRLLIGDAAIRFRNRHRSDWRYCDLGELWFRATGLPFVFAVWAMSECVPGGAASALREVKSAGLAARPQIAAREPDPDFALRYLTKHIHYDLGEREKLAVGRFEQFAQDLGLLSTHEPARLEFC